MRTFVHAGALLCPSARGVDVLRDQVVILENGIISNLESASRISKTHPEDQWIDASKDLVSPGLIDCHTHALFSGSRSGEFFQRHGGTSYEEILRNGGGIHSTVRETRASSDQDLLELLAQRLDRFLSYGVTTVEIKSGYGLSLEQEARMLKILKTVRHPIDVIPTFLGAHIVPSEYQGRRADYVRMICEDMLPEVERLKLSSICDVFCDPEAFSIHETRQIFDKARSLGFRLKIHADQLSHSGGAELAAEYGCLSADHLDHVSAAAMEKLAQASVVGVMVPTCHLFTGKHHKPPVKNLLDLGVKLAISTDCNPGTSHTTNLPLSMSLAAMELNMDWERVWLGVTLNAATALGLDDRGHLNPRAKADLCIWEADDPRDIPYRFGDARPKAVIASGRLIG